MLQVEEEKRLNQASATASRDKWDAYDPTLISEGLFAAANIFSSLKVGADKQTNKMTEPQQNV